MMEKEMRAELDEDIMFTIENSMKYVNNYYCTFDNNDDNSFPLKEEAEQDARIVISMQNKVINLMKKATYGELMAIFPQKGVDTTLVNNIVLDSYSNVMNFISLGSNYNDELESFLRIRVDAKIILGEF